MTVEHAANHAFVTGLSELFLIAAIVAFVGAVLALLLVRQRDFVGHASQGQGPAQPQGEAAPTAPAAA